MDYFDLLESLDQTYPFTYEYMTKDSISGTFDADGVKYEVELYARPDAYYTYNDKRIKAYDAEFSAIIIGGGDLLNVFSNTGTAQNPSKILATAINALVDMATKIKPDAITLIGYKEDNRTSLYNRLAARFDSAIREIGYQRAKISEPEEDQYIEEDERISWVKTSLMEDASVGATSSANIATVVMPVGPVRRRKRIKEDDVSEALDRPKELTWNKHDNLWKAQGEFSNIPYTITFDYDGRNYLSSVTHQVVPLWEIGFNKTGNGLDDSISGGVKASEIFATIKFALREFLSEKHPETIQISANAQQPSRIRLYDRFARIIDEEAAALGYRRSEPNYIKGLRAPIEDQFKHTKSYVWTRL